jgi:prevent-host-death family protein
MGVPQPPPTRRLGVCQARAALGALARSVAAGGSRVVVTCRGRPVAALVPVEDLAGLALLRARPMGAEVVVPALPAPVPAPADADAGPEEVPHGA